MNAGKGAPGRYAKYTAACTDHGYEIRCEGVLVKSYRLAAVCYLLTAGQRRDVAVDFALYDIRNEAFMLA